MSIAYKSTLTTPIYLYVSHSHIGIAKFPKFGIYSVAFGVRVSCSCSFSNQRVDSVIARWFHSLSLSLSLSLFLSVTSAIRIVLSMPSRIHATRFWVLLYVSVEYTFWCINKVKPSRVSPVYMHWCGDGVLARRRIRF